MKNKSTDFQSTKENTEEKVYSIQVWDIPTRLFHWLLVGLVILSFITGKIGISAMKYHEWSGFGILVLLGFRLVWGFMGGQQSRFGSFVKGPATVFPYTLSLLRKGTISHIGHNPLGGWSIIAMLVSLIIQVGTGLFANDDILTEGPLYPLVSKETSDWLTGVHYLNQSVLLILIAIHIGAVIFYLLAKGDNLIKPMITGNKLWHQAHDSTQGHPAIAFLLVVVIAAVAYMIIY